MNRKLKSGIGAGVALGLISVVSGLALAEIPNESLSPVVDKINAADFLGRNSYEISISRACAVMLKEINAKCPDQRGEFTFNLGEIKTLYDDYSKGLLVKAIDDSKIIRQRLYYRGATVRGRRFCEAPEGSLLKYEDKMLNKKLLFYSDDEPFLLDLKNSLNQLSDTCRANLSE